MEAGNRLAGITALCERRIGQELRSTELSRGGRPPKTDTGTSSVSPTLQELGIKPRESVEYQELAHPDVAENVILDAIAEAGKEGRFISKADIQRAAREHVDKQRAARGIGWMQHALDVQVAMKRADREFAAAEMERMTAVLLLLEDLRSAAERQPRLHLSIATRRRA
jgi:hypothetical protein